MFLLLIICALPLTAQNAGREALATGIERQRNLSLAEIDARLTNHLDRNTEIYLRFVRLERSLARQDRAASAADINGILSAAGSSEDKNSVQAVYAELSELLARAGGVRDGTRQASVRLRDEQLQLAAAERRNKDQEIARLRAQSQWMAEAKMRTQLEQLQRNQQMQLDYLVRRNQFKNVLSDLLLACLGLAILLAWSLWRVSVAHRQQALEDPLTKLKNRRFLTPFMEHETQRLRRAGLSALVLVIDVDHFKKINDRYGHATGDHALVRLAETLRFCVRNADIVSRWGGEEFVVVCSQSSEEHARVICNRIRRRLLRAEIRPVGIHSATKEPLHLTVSIGAALFSPAALNESWELALARADRAMYTVKKNGRDGWLFAPSHPGAPAVSEPTPIEPRAVTAAR
jgi:diguanylate cyclase (GGDEF)-like protein